MGADNFRRAFRGASNPLDAVSAFIGMEDGIPCPECGTVQEVGGPETARRLHENADLALCTDCQPVGAAYDPDRITHRNGIPDDMVVASLDADGLDAFLADGETEPAYGRDAIPDDAGSKTMTLVASSE